MELQTELTPSSIRGVEDDSSWILLPTVVRACQFPTELPTVVPARTQGRGWWPRAGRLGRTTFNSRVAALSLDTVEAPQTALGLRSWRFHPQLLPMLPSFFLPMLMPPRGQVPSVTGGLGSPVRSAAFAALRRATGPTRGAQWRCWQARSYEGPSEEAELLAVVAELYTGRWRG